MLRKAEVRSSLAVTRYSKHRNNVEVKIHTWLKHWKRRQPFYILFILLSCMSDYGTYKLFSFHSRVIIEFNMNACMHACMRACLLKHFDQSDLDDSLQRREKTFFYIIGRDISIEQRIFLSTRRECYSLAYFANRIFLSLLYVRTFSWASCVACCMADRSVCTTVLWYVYVRFFLLRRRRRGRRRQPVNVIMIMKFPAPKDPYVSEQLCLLWDRSEKRKRRKRRGLV